MLLFWIHAQAADDADEMLLLSACAAGASCFLEISVVKNASSNALNVLIRLKNQDCPREDFTFDSVSLRFDAWEHIAVSLLRSTVVVRINEDQVQQFESTALQKPLERFDTFTIARYPQVMVHPVSTRDRVRFPGMSHRSSLFPV